MSTAKCFKCKETKDLEEFHNNKAKLNGKNSYCKVCQIKYIEFYHEEHRGNKTNPIKYNKIQKVLEQYGITKVWLANEVGVTKSTMSAYTLNGVQPPLFRMFQIAKALRVNVAYLINEKAEIPKNK